MNIFLPWRFFRILFALWISFLHSAIFSCAEVMFCSTMWTHMLILSYYNCFLTHTQDLRWCCSCSPFVISMKCNEVNRLWIVTKSQFRTYVRVDFLIILHFPKIHVINHQRLSHGELTLGQCAHHPVILSKSKQNYKMVYQSIKAVLSHFCGNTLLLNPKLRSLKLPYPSSGVPGELHHLVKLFSSTLIRRSSPAPSPSIRRRFRITSSRIQ